MSEWIFVVFCEVPLLLVLLPLLLPQPPELEQPARLAAAMVAPPARTDRRLMLLWDFRAPSLLAMIVRSVVAAIIYSPIGVMR